MISEIALAVVLLVSAGMFGNTLLRLSSLDPGVNIHNVLVARTALSPATLRDPGRIRAAWDDILDRARRVPGVETVAAVDTVPMREGNNQLGYWATAVIPPENQQPLALATSVTPDYLKVTGIPLRRGRFFDDQDRLGKLPVVVIDDVMAQSAFGTLEAVGKQLWIPNLGTGPFAVVGVVGHVRHWGLAGDDQAKVRAQLYYPFAQVPDAWLRRWSELMSIVVRTTVPPLTVLEPLRARGAGRDQRSGAVPGADAGATGGELHRDAAVSDAAVRHLRGVVFVAGVHRHLRCAGVPDQPADSGDRRAHGAGRHGAKRGATGAAAEPGDDPDRRGRRV